MDMVPHPFSDPSPPQSEGQAEDETIPVQQRPRWMLGLGATGLFMIPVGVAVWALGELMQIPALPKCFNARQAPSTEQIYCAEQLASKHDTEHLRRAILLADAVPTDDPLRDESDRLVELWAGEILRRAEAEFQQGNLDEAIALAQEVPSRVEPYRQVQETIQTWEALWTRATDLFQQGQEAIDQEEWFQTLEIGRQLLRLDNRYWSTTRYQELMRQLQTARETSTSKKKGKVARSTLNNNTPNTVEEFMAQWEQEQEQEDITRLQQARQRAQTGHLEDLRIAVSDAQQVLYGTPRYEEAQQAIAQWRQQIEVMEDRPSLERAQQLANAGDLQAAINEANTIGWGRALYGDARDRIEVWHDQLHAQEIRQQNAELERLTGNPGISPLPVSPRSPTPAPPDPRVTPVSTPRAEPLASPPMVPVVDTPTE